MKLGELIAIARDLKGWTLRELEQRSGVSNALISQIETGHVKEPGFFTVLRISEALGLSVERLAAVETEWPRLAQKNAGKAKGGHARAEQLSPERRAEIASIAAHKRWNGNKTA